jgi:hypothetical protein
MGAPKVNFRVRTQAVAYQEGMRDGLAMLVAALEEGGHIDYLLEVLAANARAEDVAKLDSFYARKNGAGA